MQTSEEKQAQALFDERKFKESQTLFERVLESEPKNTRVMVYLSRAIQETDPSSFQVSKLLKQALSLDSTNPYTLFTMGCYYFKKHTFKPAIKYFQETLKYEKNHSGAAYNLGVCYDSLNDFHKSLEYYSLCLSLDPQSVRAITNKAIALDKIGKSEEAEGLFKKALGIEETALICNSFAVCLKRLQQSELAMKYFEKSCKLDPNYSIAHYNLGLHLAENNEIEKAVSYYKIAIKLEKSHVFGCLASGNFLESQEKFYFALKIFEVVHEVLPEIQGVSDKIEQLRQRLSGIEKISSPKKVFRTLSNFLEWTEDECLDTLIDDPSSLHAHLRLGIILCEKNDFTKSRQHLNQVSVLNPDFFPEIVDEKLAEIYFRKDRDFVRARESFTKSAKVSSNPACWIRCGKCSEKLKEFSEACGAYEKAIEIDPNSIHGYFRLGWVLVKDGKREAGLEKLEKANTLDPTNPHILAKYAEILIRDGELLEKAQKLLESALKIDPNHGETLVTLAKCYEKMKRTQEAFKLLERALEVPKVKVTACYQLAKLYESSDKSKALDLYKQCLELDKTFLPAIIHYATLLAGSGEIAKAKMYYRAAIQLDAENLTAHFSLGKIYQAASEDFEQAIRHFEIVISLNQSHFKACCQLGILYMDKGDSRRALEYLKQSIQINPKYGLAHVSIGNVYFEKNNFKESIKHFKEAHRIEPADVQALIGLGNTYLQLKKPGESIKCYIKALDLDPALPETHFNLGNAYYLKNETENAVASYKKAIELNPNKPESHYNLGNAYMAKGLNPEAISEFQLSIKLDDKNPDAYYNMANAYYFIDNYNEAINNYKQAIKIGMNSSEGYFNLGLVYYKTEKMDLALEEFKRSYELEPKNYEILYYLGVTMLQSGNAEGKGFVNKSLEIKPDYAPAVEALQKFSLG